MKAYIATYGCAYNHADSSAMEQTLQKKGVKITSEKQADILIINTCCVKEATENRILWKINHTEKPIIVTGCLAKTSKEKILKANPKAIIASQNNIANAILKKKAASEKELPESILQKPIANIRIAQGCLGRCTYCQTRLARGNLKSRPPKEIAKTTRLLVKNGALELRLTSQDCYCYGFDIQTSLPKLLKQLCKIPGHFKIRIGMGNPNHLKKILPELLNAMQHEKIYKFFHLPIQSGSDKILRDMRRGYKSAEFENQVRQIRTVFPDALIETDVIVGYPTETEDDFKQTLKMIERTRPNITNVSKFSSRPKTEAAGKKQLPNQTIKQRSEILSKVCRQITLAENQSQIGKTTDVFFTGKDARTNEYRPVIARGKNGKTATMTVTAAGMAWLRGQKQFY